MDTKKLRQKILDLAIRGKLVPQDPNDEPASVLLERIRTEKERLIKEGKIKRNKKSASSDTPHYENRQDGEANEVPFEVPESWEWTTIEDVTVNRDSERIPLSLAVRKKQQNKVYDYYGAAGVIDKVENYLFDERLLLVGEDGANLLSRSKDNAFFAEGKYWVNNHAHVLDCPNKSVLDYVAFVINSMSLENYITGSAQPKLTQDNLNKILIPLPPEKEQHRIIESVNDYFSNISLLEGEIVELDSFIQKAKSKILDFAIHGKLVPQDPNDEPAIELLKCINPKFSPCDNAQYPYDVPKNWNWCKLINICSFLSRGKSPTYSDKRIYPVFAQKCNLFSGDISLEQARFLDPNTLSKWPEEYKLRDGDVLVNSTGTGTVGRTRLFHSDVLGNFPFVVPDSHVSVVRTLDQIDSNYIYSIISSKYGQEYIEDNLAGSTNQKELYIGVLENMHIPLPPDKEQKRIVGKIEELFAVLDEIKKSIET